MGMKTRLGSDSLTLGKTLVSLAAESAVGTQSQTDQVHEPVNTPAQQQSKIAEELGAHPEESAGEGEEPLYEVHYIDQNGKEIIRYEKTPPKEGPVSEDQLKEMMQKEEQEKWEKEAAKLELQKA